MTYSEWADLHARMFAMNRDGDMEMLSSWVSRFKKEGLTPEELAEASEWLLTNRGTAYRAEHATILADQVRFRRLQLTDRPGRVSDFRYRCEKEASTALLGAAAREKLKELAKVLGVRPKAKR